MNNNYTNVVNSLWRSHQIQNRRDKNHRTQEDKKSRFLKE